MTTASRQLFVRAADHREGTARPKARLLTAQATPLPAPALARNQTDRWRSFDQVD
jgi:hypothetical protein